MNFNIITFVLTLTVLFPGLKTLPVSAHFLATDGDFGITLHVDPEDDPIVGQPATIYPDLKDKSNRFSADKCICSLTITLDSKTLGQLPFDPNEGIAYQFNQKGLYGLDFAGKSNDGSFPDFLIHYDLRVTREQAGNSQPAKTNHTIHYIIFGGGFLIFGVLIVRDMIMERKKKQKDKIDKK